MGEKIGLKIVELIHELTKHGIDVTFARHPKDNSLVLSIYGEMSLGSYPLKHPEQERLVLEKDIIRHLADILELEKAKKNK